MRRETTSFRGVQASSKRGQIRKHPTCGVPSRGLASAVGSRLLPVSLAVSLLGLTISACAAKQYTYNYAKEPDPRSREFVVGAADLLRVNVWGQQELSVDIAVRPDGKITLPLVGDVVAAGRTPSEIRDEVQSRLTAYVKSESAKVTVGVIEIRSYRFTVSGNVEKPGQYTAPSYLTVIEALSMAGGPNRFAQSEEVVILRDYGTKKYRKIPINYETLRLGTTPDMNIVIMPNDNIVVP